MELYLEFMLAKGSNSGVFLHGLYEVQIFDSYGSTEPVTSSDCGGIYPRAELQPRYHHIDKGIAPKVLGVIQKLAKEACARRAA